MEKVEEQFEQVTAKAISHLKERFSRKERTLKYYMCCWKRVKSYIDSQNIKEISSSVCRAYLLSKFKDYECHQLSKREQEEISAIYILIEFLDTGNVQIKKEQINLEGRIGALMSKYLVAKISLRFNFKTINLHERYLSRFLVFLKKNEIEDIELIKLHHILNYIKNISPRTVSSAHTSIGVLRSFFKYLYVEKILETDFSFMIPRSNRKSQPKLPSVYTTQEVEKLISSIERSSSVGKRDYAVILLAARLGLRASDIANLRFENLQWEQHKICLTQYKTGKEIELPLLAEIGNAIIDYLKLSRIPSKEPFVFLTFRSPVIPVTAVCVESIVQHAFVKSGIDIKGRRHGPHSLRHSLATRLLERKTLLPVITEVLGHVNTESTRFYLRVDLTSMRSCALNVPAVPSSFYNQKGGLFYE